jgi:ATP-dependent Lon protease
MTSKNAEKKVPQVTSDITTLISKKIVFFEDIIQRTILHVQKNKILHIIGVSEVTNCITILAELSKKIKEINCFKNDSKDVTNTDNIINILQYINNELSTLFKLYGTELFEDLLWVCFGNNSINAYACSELEKNKFELLKKYFHPTSYKILNVKKVDIILEKQEKEKEKEKKQDKDDFVLTEKSKNLDSADISIKIKPFHLKVYGLQLIVHNPQQKKSLIISGTVDDIIVDLLDNNFINSKIKAIKENAPKTVEFQDETFAKYITSLNLKDYLIYDTHEFYSKYAGYLSNLAAIRQKTIAQTVKEFVSTDLFSKRSTIIQLLIKSDKYDNQYLAYLLYDLLSNDSNGSIDTTEQTILFDSFPWSIKQYFKDAMKKTVQYTNELTNFDSQKIPLEQQICLLKASDTVKEKAMQKLKEVKAKTEDTGSKARQYLDGLLKIPFCIYKREPILNLMNEIKADFRNIKTMDKKDSYTSLEISNYLKSVHNDISPDVDPVFNANMLQTKSKNELITYILKINELIIKHKLTKIKKIVHSNKTRVQLIQLLSDFINANTDTNINIVFNKELKEIFVITKDLLKDKDTTKDGTLIKQIEDKFNKINSYMGSVTATLDAVVHSHEKAKKQVERIVAQWIAGNDNTGYVLGFEGAPGIGKTTLAKGLANCLKDEEGNSRPFSLIAIGGDANSSSLVGHSYTYVGSTWGQIVQILMDKKCMNPIILIDEVDKISRTEHGKEIIGILTHLLDTSQNECFQDKYFSGIDLDLSKVLFILSYNDVDAIDKILLDRVHRIKFDNLSIEDKIEISNKHLLPDIYKKVGLDGMIEITKETLKFIIEEYTLEPGVRKLKEKLYEIVGEINLEIMKNTATTATQMPIIVTIDDVKNKYFKDRREIKIQTIAKESRVGSINCLYATSLGSSGILAASAKFFPATKFLELRLTGLLDQMMQESFQISLTLAYNMLSDNLKTDLLTNHSKSGIHLHMGDGSVSKSGTSAGIAITILMYSLLSGKKIKNTFAVTGEAADLNGKVGEIGALNYKFKGGIKAGVKSFIFPVENAKDYDEFMKKYGSTSLVEGISFHQVDHIDEAIALIME